MTKISEKIKNEGIKIKKLDDQISFREAMLIEMLMFTSWRMERGPVTSNLNYSDVPPKLKVKKQLAKYIFRF